MIKYGLLCLFILTLSSCGFKRIIIPNIDNAIVHQLTKNFDLYTKQEEQLEKDIKILLNQMRPQVATHLAPILSKITVENLKEAPLIELRQQLNSVYQEGSVLVAKIMAYNIKLLDDKQWQQFKTQYDKENQDIEKRINKYDIKLIQKRIEFFIGPLKTQQIEKLNSLTPILIQKNQRRLANRISLMTKMEEHRKSKFKESLDQVFTEYNEENFKQFDSPESQILYETIHALLLMNDKKQNTELKKKLATAKEWIDYFIKYEY
jgi:rubrerythrin